MTARLKRKERITEARTGQILKAALAVFASKGYGGSTMADIAKAAGVGVGTLYNYYDNKRDLLISLVQQSLASKGLINTLDKMTAQGTRDFMDTLLEERLEFGFGNAQTILFLFFEIQRDPKLRKQYVQQVIGPIVTRIEEYIGLQVKTGAFRDVDEKIIARMMVGTIIGSMILYRLEQRDSPFKKSNRKQIAHEMSGLFMQGLERK